MRYLYIIMTLIFINSCVQVEDKQEQKKFIINNQSDEISFIINLKVNENSSEDLNQFIEDITQNVINTENFCIEYGYYISEDSQSITLYEKYENSEGAIKHGQNFIEGPFYDKFFNLFTLEKFVVTGSASDEFKKFTSENGFVIDYRESIDGFKR